jgi:Mesyanzhinovviridae DNA polymerase
MKRKNYHHGGEQLLLIKPPSSWTAPTELPDLRGLTTRVVLDVEGRDDGLATKRGPGWATGAGHLTGVAIAWMEGLTLRSAYYSIQHPESDNFDRESIRRWLLDHRHLRFAFHNAHYDIGWIWWEFGVELLERVDDTACMGYMVDENRLNYGLDYLCRWRGLPGKRSEVLEMAAECYHLDPKREMHALPARYVGEYAEQDAASTLLLAENLDLEIERQNLSRSYQLEMDLVPMVHHMRRRGVRIDLDRCEQLYDKFTAESRQALDDISDRLRQTVGIDQLRSGAWLERTFDALKIKYPRTANDRGSFEAKWMRHDKHWLPPLIVQAKSREDMAEKFIMNYLIGHRSAAGRVHPSINQYRGENLYDEDARGGGTRTYRFSYSDPPLQQIPHRDEVAAEIRSAFVPEEGEEWASADYSQQEYRLIVHYAALREMPKADEALRRYQEDPDTDFHQMVADMTGLDRKPAKDCNFAKAYGAGVRKFALMTNKSKVEAEKIMRQYDAEMPFVKMLYDECARVARKRGYIVLLDGARVRFDLWFAGWRTNNFSQMWRGATAACGGEEAARRCADPEHPWYGKQSQLRRAGDHKALNSLIQGGAARQTKIAMRDCWRAGFLPLLQIHDELCFSLASREDGAKIAQIMREAVSLAVPMKVDVDIGPSWWAGRA